MTSFSLSLKIDTGEDHISDNNNLCITCIENSPKETLNCDHCGVLYNELNAPLACGCNICGYACEERYMCPKIKKKNKM